MFFPKGAKKNSLICRAAVKLEGRSPESEPLGLAWLDGTRRGKSVQCVPPFGKIIRSPSTVKFIYTLTTYPVSKEKSVNPRAKNL
ncbi:MAG: hypothetical protein IJ599_03765 [Alphaproteobacteria bacterium]|nr:hypothetical protein [Alphaproteobacteria bacterium]